MSIPLMGVLVFLSAFFGPIPLLLVAGYILVVEQNSWLRQSAIKAVVIYAIFVIVPILINLLWGPSSLINLLERFIRIFDNEFRISVDFLDSFFSFVLSAISTASTFVFVAFAAMAIKQKTIKMGPIDKM